MTDCKICGMIESGELKKVYEDEKIVAVLSNEPVSVGHILVIPKKHYAIIEQIPDYEVGYIFSVTNKISISLFEILKVHGTNIFTQNGVAAGQKHSHFMIHIIPRMPNDNINLAWEPRQLTEEEMSTVELRVKDHIKVVGYFEKEKPKPLDLDRKPEVLADQEDYLVKSLRRIP